MAPVLLVLALAQAPPDTYLRQSPGAGNPKDADEWRAGEKIRDLKSYPRVSPGDPNPDGGMKQFGGSGATSFGRPDLGMPFRQWRDRMSAQRPAVDAAAQRTLRSRYDLNCAADPGATMSRGKPLAVGPAAILPKGYTNWEQYAAQDADAIRRAGSFPYTPLDHPLQSTGHMLFPRFWTAQHPEHERFDAGFDIPDCFLPEYPPAMYLTTHPELGDVEPRRRDHVRKLLRPVQRCAHGGTARRFTLDGDAIPYSMVQFHASPRHRGAFARRDVLELSSERAHERRDRAGARQPPQLRTSPRGFTQPTRELCIPAVFVQEVDPDNGSFRRSGRVL